MRRSSSLILVACLLATLLAGAGYPEHVRAAGSPPQAATAQPTPVIVELFTSEGCSSCPPADALIARLQQTQPLAGAEIIALKEHVDYWNGGGWRDPYSSAQFTARQQEYSAAFGDDQVFTPEMVVDGRVGFVGSQETHAWQVIAHAAQIPKVPVRLDWAPAEAGKPLALQIHVDSGTTEASSETASVFLAITEDHLHSDVLRGENAGKKFEHFAVTRELKNIGKFKSSSSAGFSTQYAITLESDWKRENLRAVVFVQENRSRHIVGSAAIALPVP